MSLKMHNKIKGVNLSKFGLQTKGYWWGTKGFFGNFNSDSPSCNS